MAFSDLSMPPADALHGVMALYAADHRDQKLDLGVGVYRNAEGRSEVMRAVREAEVRLAQNATSKSYLALRGVDRFLDEMTRLLYPHGANAPVACVQTVGGTGGIRLAMELALRAESTSRLLLGLPSWPNHATIAGQIGMEVVDYQYFDKATQTLNFSALCDTIKQANPGDVLVLHGPCHNPTGADLSRDQISSIIELMRANGVIPLIDAAYYGMDAPIDDDLRILRSILDGVEEGYLIMSCSKVFGLYRERVGILFVKCHSNSARDRVQPTLERIARGTYSMPPAHGGEVVAAILSDLNLKAMWRDELDGMRHRIQRIRQAIGRSCGDNPCLAKVADQSGIFSLLPIDETEVARLATDHAIYLPSSGRINVAGLRDEDVPIFCDALSRSA